MGYGKPSRANTLDRVDDAALEREFAIRNLRCEVPGCYEQAVGMFKSGVPAWACRSHLKLWSTFKRALESAVVTYVRGHVAVASSLAYEHSFGEEFISFGALTDDIMIKSRAIMADAQRFATAPPASPSQRTLTADIPATVVRPPLATLGPENASGLLFDPFTL